MTRLIARILSRRLPLVLAVLAVTAGWAGSALAQVSVTATAGTLGPTPYATVKLAFDAINAGTHQGAINVDISANTTEGATPATLNSSGAGAASYTSVLVRPTADGVSVSGNPVTGFGVIQLNGADNVTIDGDNPNTGGINRNLTVNNTAVATVIANSAVRIATSATAPFNSNNNLTIKNCNLNGNVTGGNSAAIISTTGSSNSSFGLIVGPNGGAAVTAITSVTGLMAVGVTVNGLVIDNNAVNQCARGIVFLGATASPFSSTGITITNNTVGAAGALVGAPPYVAPTTTVYTKGIYVSGTNAVTASGNTVQNILSYVSTQMNAIELNSGIGSGSIVLNSNNVNGVVNNGTVSGARGIDQTAAAAGAIYSISSNSVTNVQTLAGVTIMGIQAAGSATSGTIQLNKVTQVYSRGSGGFGSYGINQAAGSNVTIQNNFVSDINAFQNNGALTTTFGPFGIRLATGTGHKVLQNSVNLFGALVGTSSFSSSAALAVVTTASTGMDIRNNIFSNTMTGGLAGSSMASVMLPSAGTSAMNLSWNNNAYYQGAGTGAAIGQVGTTSGTGIYLAAGFDAGTTAGAGNLRNYTSVLSAAGTNDNGSLASGAAAPFTSATDLHIPFATATNLESAGGPTGVTTDIDGETRPGPPGSVNGGGTANDIGADEFDGIPVDGTAPSISYSPLSNTTSTSNRSFTSVVVTDASGVNGLSGTRPRVYFKKTGDANTFVDNTSGSNGWKYAEASGSTSPFDFTIDYSLLFSGPVVVGDVVQYFVVAQDLASTPNVGINTGSFATAATSVALTAGNFPIGGTIRSYTIVNPPLNGDYTVGLSSFREISGIDLSFERHVEMVTRESLEPVAQTDRAHPADHIVWRSVTRQVEQVSWVPMENGRPYDGPLSIKKFEKSNATWSPAIAGTYATITAAVNDLNLRGVSGPVRFLLVDATYPSETFPITVNVTGSAPSAANPVTIKPNTGVTASVSGAAASSMIFRVTNTNYITIDGSNTVGGTTRDLSIENTSITSPIVVLFGSTGTTAITNETLKNCNIRNGVNTNSAVVTSDNTTPGNPGVFSNITIQNNLVEKAFIGVYTNGGTVPQGGSNVTYADNTLNTVGANAIARVGLYMQGVNGATVRNNDIGNTDQITDENDVGVWFATGTANATANANRIHDLNYPGINGFGPKGFQVSTGNAAAGVTLSNNMVFNVTGDGDSYASFGMSFSPAGIYVFGAGQGGVSVLDNSIFLYGNTLNFSAGAYSVGIALDDGAAANVSGNNVVNNLGRLAATGAGSAAIALELTAAQLTAGNYNNLFCNATGGGSNLVGKIAGIDYPTLLGWQGASGRDGNSVTGNPLYVSPTDLHIDTSNPAVSPVSNVGASNGILTDYDGQARNGLTPDIGADEFDHFVTITASAGANGSISPSGAVSVADHGSQTFTITPDACFMVADVIVDGSSVGAVSSYTFTNVITTHTITASFTAAGPYTITSTAGPNGSISPSGATLVNCGADQSYTISPDFCYSVQDVLVDGNSVGALTSYTFINVQANHTISASFTLTTYTIVASAGAGGAIAPSGNVPVTCDGSQTFTITPDACHTIGDVLVDGISQGAVASYTFTNVQANHTIAASFTVIVAPVPPVTGVAATQVKLGNDTDGTTKITVSLTSPGGAYTVEVWRKGFGSYPTYDNGGGSAPPLPGAYPPAGWTLTGVTASGQQDETTSRDYWYFVAYAKDACGNVSPVSNMTTGTLNYHLGDVTDGVTPGSGNNTVNTGDFSLLGAHYGLSGGALAGFEYLDVGPTTNNNTNGRPTTDSKTNFEDLVIFSLNYTPTVSAVVAKGVSTQAAAEQAIALRVPETMVAGQTFDVPVDVAGRLQALSVTLKWDETLVEPVEVATGDGMSGREVAVLSPGPGRVDAAMLGAGRDLPEGTVAVVRFRALRSGEPGITVGEVLGRNASNEAVAVKIQATLSRRAAVTATELMPVVPNPAFGRATVGFALAKAGRVDLAIYSVDGRLVKNLARGEQDAGRYEINWNGTDERGSAVRAGQYFVRFQAPGIQKTRNITLVR